MAIIYLMVIFTTLVAFASLAVDGGRYYLARSQLQGAADAAARYGASGLIVGWETSHRPNTAEAIERAISAASDNLAEGKPVTISAGDIQCFSYDPQTLQSKTGLNGPSYAIQVTTRRTLSLMLGMRDISIKATATAKIDPPGDRYGLVGLDWVKISGNGLIDSYDSARGPYSNIGALSGGDVTSNGDITLSGNAHVRGDVHPGVGQSVRLSGNAQVSGSRSPLTESLSYPDAALPAQYDNGGSLNISGNKRVDLPAGAHYYNGFSISGNATLNISGPVTIYVDGDVELGGNANVFENLPRNFRIVVLGAGSVTTSGNGTLYADIYAPQSVIKIAGNGDFFGAAVGKTLEISGNGDVHYDQQLGAGGVPSGSVVLIR